MGATGREVQLQQAIFDDGKHRAITWNCFNAEMKGLNGDHWDPRVLIELDVDGNIDYVSADLRRYGDLETLSRSINVLTKLRDRLTEVYGDQPRSRGRCPADGEWGDCKHEFGHTEPCSFPLPPEDERHKYTAADLAAFASTPLEGSWSL